MKRLISIGLAVAMILSATVTTAFAEPAEGDTPHQHVYSDQYTYDKEYHWKQCIVEGCPNPEESIDQKGAHNLELEKRYYC